MYLAAAYYLNPAWWEVAAGFVPSVPRLESTPEYLLFAYYAVALLSSVMLPYETYFYASGAIEDKWTAKDVPINRVIVIVGFTLGSLLAVALVVLGANVYEPLHIEPELPGLAALSAAIAF